MKHAVCRRPVAAGAVAWWSAEQVQRASDLDLQRLDAVVFRGDLLTRAHLNLLMKGRLKPGDGQRAGVRR